MGSTSPREIKHVALTGATGSVGSNVLNGLLKLNRFNITILTRKEGVRFDGDVKVKLADFTSVESLTETLRDQDAVIDTTKSMEMQTPINLINAAAAAGVYRFITSDFGLDPLNPKVSDLPVFARKAVSFRAAKEACEKTGMTYTAVTPGVFLDWNLRNSFSGIDLFAKEVQLFDDGTHVVPWTTLEHVGTATASVLAHPAETENRVVYVSSIVKSQKEIVDVAKEALGGDGWKTTTTDMDALFKQAMEAFKAGVKDSNYSGQIMGSMIQYAISKADYSGPWEKDDNDLLGVEPMSDDELKDLIKEIVAERG